ncbi:MAG: hypothetical protein JWL70_2320 [Acidimicrobiia bacterium]|nr:hypothetical protein [Acidimicrobiia bacterium]
MPSGLILARTTPEFTEHTVPAGLLAAHRVAAGTWGRLRVVEGTVRFVFEDDPEAARELLAGDGVDIPPTVLHRVEPGPGSRFFVEFYVAP